MTEAGSVRGEGGFFWPARLARWALAEVACALGNMAPRPLAKVLWKVAVSLDRHQEVAAMNRALAFLDEAPSEASWEAFEEALRPLENPWATSASDLHLRRTPGRLMRFVGARWFWGPASANLDQAHRESLEAATLHLARRHYEQRLGMDDRRRAGQALDVLSSVLGEQHPEVFWAQAEMAWRQGNRTEALDRIVDPMVWGDVLHPLEIPRWVERALEMERLDLAEDGLRHACRFLPEEAVVWRWVGRWARAQGDEAEAQKAWERALALDPQDLEARLALLGDPPEASLDVDLQVPKILEIGQAATVECRLRGVDGGNWNLFPMPPRGRGILPDRAVVEVDAEGQARFKIAAHRSDRIGAGPWPLLILVVGPPGHGVFRHEIRVPDATPGEILVTVTEDHEIHEERGILTPSLLQRLLVEKSRFAASDGVPWTHMVEVGSTLAMAEVGAQQGDETWQALRDEIRAHLAEEVARGNDLEPHLHTFNDPAYEHFPYRWSAEGWQPHRRFLLTPGDRRGDWASVCPPPARRSEGLGFDRLESVERAVAQLESVGRLGDPDYRPILWRSGLLEVGETEAERCWSMVALRSAGLMANSDLPKPGSPSTRIVSAAFLATRPRPFDSQPGGAMLQLPIVANLEGDYRMESSQLDRRVQGCVASVRSTSGAVKPGVHLFTLITHDKFFNARRERDEFRLDRDYGDWPVVDAHLEAWRREGARVVTAREGVEAVLEDQVWHPVARLQAETFVLQEPSGSEGWEIRYRLRLLGRGIQASEEFPIEVLVPIPCSLRGRVASLHVTDEQGPRAVETDSETSPTAFWWRLRGGELPEVVFRVDRSLGPRLVEVVSGTNERRLTLEADEGFLAARLLFPWSTLSIEGDGALGSAWQVEDRAGREISSEVRSDGLLLKGVRFETGTPNRPWQQTVVLRKALRCPGECPEEPVECPEAIGSREVPE